MNQLTESQEQALETSYTPVLPVYAQELPGGSRLCRWCVIDSAGQIVEGFPNEQQAKQAAETITHFFA